MSEHDPKTSVLVDLSTRDGLDSGRRSTANPATKKCPDCAEDVRAEARKCRFCGFIFPEPPPVEPKPTQAEDEAVPAPTLEPEELPLVNIDPTPAPQVEPNQPKKGFNWAALAICALIFLWILWIGHAALPRHGLNLEDLDGEPVSDPKELSALFDAATKRISSDHPDFHSENFRSQVESIIHKKGGHFTVLLHYRDVSSDRRFLCSINATGTGSCEEK